MKQSIIKVKEPIINYNALKIGADGIEWWNGKIFLEIFGRSWKYAGELLDAANCAYNLGRAHGKIEGFNQGVKDRERLYDSHNNTSPSKT